MWCTSRRSVLLNLNGQETVRAATTAMLDRLNVESPALRIDGFLVQPMIIAQRGLELIAGIGDDPLFGPVLLFGQGCCGAATVRWRCRR